MKQDFEAFVDRTARQVVARARRTSEQNLREARLPAAEAERVLDMLDESDVTNYELVVAQIRRELPRLLRAARVETTVH